MTIQRVRIETVENGFIVQYEEGSNYGFVVFTEWQDMLSFACQKLGKDPDYVVEFKHKERVR